VAAFLFSVLVALPARAEPAPATEGSVDLVWNAPPGCPTREAVLAEVRRALTSATLRPAVTRADVSRLASERWSVHLVTNVGGVEGERSLEADSCAALVTATALIVAWTIDPLHAAQVVPTPPSPPRRLAGGPSPEDFGAGRSTTDRTAGASSATPSRLRLAGVFALGGQADVGTLPRAGYAVEITVGAVGGRFRAEASGSAWAGEDVTTNASEGTHLHLFDGTIRGCWRGWVGRTIELDPCLGVGAVHASSDGFGETTPFRRDGWWSIARGDLLLSWVVVGPVALRAMVGVVVPIARPAVVILNPEGGAAPVAETSPVALRGALGLEVKFP
jgi:hypothetical protein